MVLIFEDLHRYFRNHSYELNLCWSACEHLKELGVDVGTIRFRDIEEHIQKLTDDKDQLISSYKAKDKEYKKLRQMDESLTLYLCKFSLSIPERSVRHNKTK